jgi:aldose 1-epimerase
MDFVKPTAIGQHIKDDHPQLKFAEPKQGGFDFNCWIPKATSSNWPPKCMTLPRADACSSSNEPGVQFYTSNFLDGSVKGKGGKTYRHWWFHLGDQHFPDAP